MATKFQEEVDKLLECVICLEEIKQPKMLQCPHSFCFDPCLKNLAKERNSEFLTKYALECPICRKESFEDKLENLPDNLYLKNLTEIRKKQLKPEDIITQTGSGKVGESIQFSSHIFWLKR